jgi:hypothetical protein
MRTYKNISFTRSTSQRIGVHACIGGGGGGGGGDGKRLLTWHMAFMPQEDGVLCMYVKVKPIHFHVHQNKRIDKG